MRAPRTTVGAGLVTVSVLGGEVVRDRASAYFLGPGNYVFPNGTLGNATVSGTRPDLLPRSVLAVPVLVGVLAVLLLVLAVIPTVPGARDRLHRRRLGPPVSPALVVVTLAAVGSGLACTVPAVFGLWGFDRYLLLLVPLVGVLVLRVGGGAGVAGRGVRITSGAALVMLAGFGAVFVVNAASFDGAKWRVAEQAVKVAGGPKLVEGGFEWTNYHAGREIFSTKRVRRAAGFCVVLRAEPGPSGGGAIRVWGPTGTQVWIVARKHRPC